MVDKRQRVRIRTIPYQRFSKEDADSYVKSYVRNGDNQRLGRPNLTDEPHASTLGSNARIVFQKMKFP